MYAQLKLCVLAFGTVLRMTAVSAEAPSHDERRGGSVILDRADTQGSYSFDVVYGGKRRGPSAYAKALAKWGAKVPESLVNHPRLKSIAGDVGGLDAFPTDKDVEWLAQVSIGTPPQTLNLDLDTGSADFWVFSTELSDFQANGQTLWDPNKSTTATPLPSYAWSIEYGDGSYAEGDVYLDVVQLGNITIGSVPVEAAYTVSSSLAADSENHGLIGLAFNLSSQVQPDETTFLQKLAPHLDENLFAVDLRSGNKSKSHWTFGGIDHTAYTGDISWQPVLREDVGLAPGHWAYKFSSFNVGGTNVWYKSNWHAIADTGTTLLLLDKWIVDRYYKQVPSSASDEYGIWVYPCSAVAKLPDFNFGFNDGYSGKVPGQYMNYAPYNETFCMGAMQEAPPDLGVMIVGDTLLKAQYVVFDIGQSRIGFANKDLELDD